MSKTFILREGARGIQPVSIDDSLMTDCREIFLTEAVTTDSCAELLKQLMYLDSMSNDPVTLYINSPGGDVISGLAVYDFIRSMQSPVTTVTMGISASMGAVLFLAGDTRLMQAHSKLMLHDPSFGSLNLGGRKPDEIQVQLDSLKETRDVLANIIAGRSGKTLEQVMDICKTDSYFTAQQALDEGFATGIIENTKEHNKNNKCRKAGN